MGWQRRHKDAARSIDGKQDETHEERERDAQRHELAMMGMHIRMLGCGKKVVAARRRPPRVEAKRGPC